MSVQDASSSLCLYCIKKLCIHTCNLDVWPAIATVARIKALSGKSSDLGSVRSLSLYRK